MCVMDRKPGHGLPYAALAAVMALASGCGERAAEGDNGGSGLAAQPAAEAAQWVAKTAGGSTVQVAPHPNPPRPGIVHFTVTLDDAAPDPLPLTADLASPTMPTHGVVRFTSERLAPRRYLVVAQIPMEGRWALYVNLDDGANAASLAFDVPAADGAAAGQAAAHSH